MKHPSEPESNESAGEKERRGIQSIEVGGQLLLALGNQGARCRWESWLKRPTCFPAEPIRIW